MKDPKKTNVRVKALNWKDHEGFVSNVYVNESGRQYVCEEKEIVMEDGKKHKSECFIALDMLTDRGIKFTTEIGQGIFAYMSE